MEPLQKSNAEPRVRPTDTQIGKRIPKKDAPEKATGRTRYIADINVSGQLYGKILRSTEVHARIRAIDVSAARAFGMMRSGVVRVSVE